MDKGGDKQVLRAELEGSLFVKGGPAAKVGSETEKIRKSLTIPKFISELLKTGASDQDNEALRSIFGEEMVQVVSAFFRLLLALKKAKREFGLVLFSSLADPRLLVTELNLLFAGDHPSFNGKNGTQSFKMDTGKNGRSFQIWDQNSFSVTWENPADQMSLSLRQSAAPKGESPVANGALESWAWVEESLKRV
jgi:hypothetical protein